MTFKKFFAAISVVALFLGNGLLLQAASQPNHAASISVQISFASAVIIFGAMVVLSKNLRIASGAAIWWMSLSISSILLPLTSRIEDDFMGIGALTCWCLGMCFFCVGVTLWVLLPWNVSREDANRSSFDD